MAGFTRRPGWLASNRARLQTLDRRRVKKSLSSGSVGYVSPTFGRPAAVCWYNQALLVMARVALAVSD